MKRLLADHLVTLLLIAHPPASALVQLRKQVEGDVGRLKIPGFSMAEIMHQRSQRSLARWSHGSQSVAKPGNVDTGQHPHGNRFGIAFNPRNLSGKKDIWMLSKIKRLCQQRGRIDVCVAVDLAVAKKARVSQSRNQAQYARLFAILQVV